MDKFWMVYSIKNAGVLHRYAKKSEAEDEARRLQARDHEAEIYILEAVSRVVRPVPAFVVEDM